MLIQYKVIDEKFVPKGRAQRGAFYKGAIAYRKGVPLDKNPYSKEEMFHWNGQTMLLVDFRRPFRQAWEQGWLAAQDGHFILEQIKVEVPEYILPKFINFQHAVRQGALAYYDGVPREKNPYNRPRYRAWWEIGYHFAASGKIRVYVEEGE